MLNPINKRITLGIDKYEESQSITIKQGYLGTLKITASFYDKKGLYTIPENTTAKVRMLKGDKKKVLNNAMVEGNEVIISVTQEMQAAPGDGLLEVILMNEGTAVTSSTCNIKILPNIHDDAGLESTDEWITVIESLATVDKIISDYEAKYENLEQEYVGELTNVKSKLQQIETDYHTAAANLTVDSEVIIARNSVAKNKPFTDIDKRFEEIETDVIGGANRVASLESKTNLAVVDTKTSSFIQSITADDALVEIVKIEGESKQTVTVQGKNLFDKSKGFLGTNLYIDTSSVKTSSGVSSIYMKCQPNTTYVISKVLSQRFVVAYSYILPILNTPVYGTAIDVSTTVKRITTDSSAQYLIVYLYNSSNDTLTLAEILASLQIELGSTATTYELFTPNSPSPDYPSPITYANSFIAVSCGKNLFNINKVYSKSADVTNVTLVGDTIAVTSNNTGTYSNIEFTLDNDLFNGKTVKFSHKTFSSAVSTVGSIVQLIYRVGTTPSYFNSTLLGTIITFPINLTSVVIRVLLNNQSTAPNLVNTVTVSGIQLEYNNKTDYEDYKGVDKINIAFPFMSVPSGVKNSIKLVNGVWNKVTRVKEKVLNGTSADGVWTLQSVNANGINNFAITLTDFIHGINNYRCDKLKNQTTAISSTIDEGIYCSASVLYVRLSTSRIESNVATFKTWLASNPLTVQYELATPIYTPISPLNLKSYKGITNIFTTSEIQPNLTVNILSRLKNTYEVLINKITQLTNAIIRLGGTV